MRGYNEILCPKGVHQHFPAFRNYEEYAGGGLADMGARHFDIAQWALQMDSSGPTTIEPPAGGTTGLKFTYENGVEVFHGGPGGCTFEGTEGTIAVDRGKLESDPGTILSTPLGDDARRVTPSNHHLRNLLPRPLVRVEVLPNNGQPTSPPPRAHRRPASRSRLPGHATPACRP